MAGGLTKILYVEDDPDIAFLAELTLREIGGFDVRHCASGEAALEAMPDFAPDLVLMDVMMPGMDGCETFRRMQTMPSGAAPTILMTAKAQTHEQEAYRAMGAIGVIAKPFDTNTLCDLIEGYWRQAKAA